MQDKQELEDEEGMTVECRVISLSVAMMVKGAGKHKELVGKVFRFFAVFLRTCRCLRRSSTRWRLC